MFKEEEHGILLVMLQRSHMKTNGGFLETLNKKIGLGVLFQVMMNLW